MAPDVVTVRRNFAELKASRCGSACCATCRTSISLRISSAFTADAIRSATLLRSSSRLDGSFAWMRQSFHPGVTWRDLDFVRDTWDGPPIITGILNPDDARMAAEVGAEPRRAATPWPALHGAGLAGHRHGKPRQLPAVRVTDQDSAIINLTPASRIISRSAAVAPSSVMTTSISDRSLTT